METIPANIRVMQAHGAHNVAVARLVRRQRLGAFLAFFANLFKPLAAPGFAPTRFLNRFAGAPSGSKIVVPTSGLHIEAGLAFTVNADCTNVPEDDGMGFVGSYMPALLLEAVDHTGWGYLLCGAPISADECEDPYCRPITLAVNGVVAGNGDTDGLTHSVAALVAQASFPIALRAGEIIFTGAAKGCASDVLGLQVKAGDTLMAAIEGLGEVSAQLL